MDSTISVASFLLVLAAIAVGVVSAVVTTWSLRSRLYSLEDRVNMVEGVTQREVKIRAAGERGKKLSAQDEQVALALSQARPPEPSKNWWELPGLPRKFNG